MIRSLTRLLLSLILFADGKISQLQKYVGRWAGDYYLKEAFVKEGGEQWLHTDGFDTYLYNEGLAHLIYRGRLKKVHDEGTK